MKKHRLSPISRRSFLGGILSGGALLSSHVSLGMPYGEAHNYHNNKQPDDVLQGNHFALDVEYSRNKNAKLRNSITINRTLPAPTLRMQEGDLVTIEVNNKLSETTSIHWHGIILPSEMDGVPGLSFNGIEPGNTFTYQFPIQQNGTYWYHSHSGFQEQIGMYGALIIDPKQPEPYTYQRDHVIVLSDWPDQSPQHIYSLLKKSSDYYQANPRTIFDLWDDLVTQGILGTWNDRKMWQTMRMSDRDLSDVSGYTYTYMMNHHAVDDGGWIGMFNNGETVRLRIINASAMTFFDFRIPDLSMQVIASDGQYVQPIEVDELRIGVAETYDILVTPKKDTAYFLFAQAIDRSGYAIGTLTPDIALTAAPLPALDPVPILSHTDMGMSMHHAHNSQHNKQSRDSANIRTGVQVDMLAEQPKTKLNDPGPGLRHHARRILTYSDLQSLYPLERVKHPDREVVLHLTGNMHRYIWSFDGIPFNEAKPLRWRYGDKVRITLINNTMMHHPIHLHGMWSDLDTGREFPVRKHTIVVQPGSQISYTVNVDAYGKWAYHCHLLYHMLGMFRVVEVS